VHSGSVATTIAVGVTDRLRPKTRSLVHFSTGPAAPCIEIDVGNGDCDALGVCAGTALL